MKLNGKDVVLGVKSAAVKTETIDESGKGRMRDEKGSSFLCPKEDQVIVGRMHLGDENGKTTYKYGPICFINDDNNRYEFKMSDVFYSDYDNEDESKYFCNEGELIVGREHVGDEKGQTRYAYRKLYVREKGKGKDAEWILCKQIHLLNDDETSDKVYKTTTKESGGEWAEVLRVFTDPLPERTYYAPMCGREHKGDENENTKTYFTLMTFDRNGTQEK